MHVFGLKVHVLAVVHQAGSRFHGGDGPRGEPAAGEAGRGGGGRAGARAGGHLPPGPGGPRAAAPWTPADPRLLRPT